MEKQSKEGSEYMRRMRESDTGEGSTDFWSWGRREVERELHLE